MHSLYENENLKDHIYELKASLYGLPQSAHNWYATLRDTFKKLDLNQCRLDACIYYNQQKMIILTHFDDILIMSPNNDETEVQKNKIKSKLEIVDNGEISSYLKIEFKYLKEKKMLIMNQRSYIEKSYNSIRIKPKPNIILLQTSTDLFAESEWYEDIEHYQ